MKVTKSRLTQIIQEELEAYIKDNPQLEEEIGEYIPGTSAAGMRKAIAQLKKEKDAVPAMRQALAQLEKEKGVAPAVPGEEAPVVPDAEKEQPVITGSTAEKAIRDMALQLRGTGKIESKERIFIAKMMSIMIDVAKAGGNSLLDPQIKMWVPKLEKAFNDYISKNAKTKLPPGITSRDQAFYHAALQTAEGKVKKKLAELDIPDTGETEDELTGSASSVLFQLGKKIEASGQVDPDEQKFIIEFVALLVDASNASGQNFTKDSKIKQWEDEFREAIEGYIVQKGSVVQK